MIQSLHKVDYHTMQPARASSVSPFSDQKVGEKCTKASVEIRLSKQSFNFKGIHIIKDRNNNPFTISGIGSNDQLYVIWQRSTEQGCQSHSSAEGAKLIEYKESIDV